MHSTTKIQQWMLLLLIFSVFAHANGGPIGAKASVSSQNILLGDMLVLKIRARGKSATFPSIKNIDGVPVLRQHERVTNIHTYNHGELQRERTTLVLTFAPQKDMTIPSYTVEIEGKMYKTKPIRIKVKKSNSSPFSLTLKANKRSVIVGESFIVTVSFYLQHGTVITKQLEYNKPAFPGFFVEETGEGKSYDEGSRQVTELKYILTPHTEGNFTLEPAHAKIGLQDKHKSNMVTMGYGTKWLEKASNTLEIEVLPQKTSSDLVGVFSMKTDIDTQKIKANKPLNLTVHIEGEGNLFNFDLLNYEIDGVTIYSDDADIELQVKDEHIYSSYNKKFVFISDKSFTIPARTFSVYDLKDQKIKTLKIDAYHIEVEGSKAAAVPLNPASKSKENYLKEKSFLILSEKEQIALFSFILGALLMYLLRYLPKRVRKADKTSEALKLLYGHISENEEVEKMVRKLYARKNGDASVLIDEKKLKALMARYR